MSFLGGLFGSTPTYNPPPPPNPTGVAATQDYYNQQAARRTQEANMIGQSGPYGSMQYVQTGTNPDGTPQYTLQTTLSPEEQGLFTKGIGIQGGEADLANALLASKGGALSGNPLDLSENATETRLNQLYHGQNDPLVQQQREALTQQLYNRGIRQGDAAYDTAMRDFEDQNARNSNQFLMSAHQLGTSDIMNEYNSPLQTLQTLQGAAAPTGPTQLNTPTTTVQAPDYSGTAMQSAQMQNQNYNNLFNTQQKQQQATMGGLFGLGKAAITAGAALL